ncbi:MAG: response regulator [Gemmatimonadales bacterium]
MNALELMDPERRIEAPEREARYLQLVELAPDAILVHDGERIVVANAAAVRLAGATRREQVVGQPIDRFLSLPYLKAAEAQLLTTDDSGPRPGSVRDTFRRLDGSEVEVEVAAIAFLDADQPSAHLVVRDISERLAVEAASREADHRLQHAQKMEAVGALAGGVAHEVNNMMAVIIGFGEFLLRDSALPPDRISDVRRIVGAASRAATVTRQLLSFSRRAFIQPQAVDLGAALLDLQAMVRRLLGEGRRLIVATGPELRVWVDVGQLEQVIVNLALNARDAMPGEGTLTLAAAEIAVRPGLVAADGAAIPVGHYALLTVQDTGIGMAGDTQASIFEPFFSTKPTGQGTGLGLSAVYGIVKQNGGHIAVSSAPGRGATFSVYLPIRESVPDAGRPAQVAPPGPVPPHAGSTVLVVDDEPDVRVVVARSLESGGHRVFQASDGLKALELIERQGPPHLVLTDLIMPGMGGIELARRLSERWPSVPVLYMSGYSADDLRREGIDGLEGKLLQKPFTPDAVLAHVGAALVRVALH